jgi:hypothetical protein
MGSIVTVGADVVDWAVVRSAEELVPPLRENAAEAERLNRLPAASIEALEKAGLTRLTTPKQLGGAAGERADRVRGHPVLARGCGSTSWVVALYALCGFWASLFPDSVQEEVFARPGARARCREPGASPRQRVTCSCPPRGPSRSFRCCPGSTRQTPTAVSSSTPTRSTPSCSPRAPGPWSAWRRVSWSPSLTVPPAGRCHSRTLTGSRPARWRSSRRGDRDADRIRPRARAPGHGDPAPACGAG